MNLILAPSLPTSETVWPLVRPTGFLSPLAVLCVSRMAPSLKPVEVIASAQALAQLRSRAIEDGKWETLQQLIRLYPVEIPPRHDWVRMAWETRNPATPEWVNAAYEDAVFSADGRPYAVLRFVRYIPLMLGKDDPCGLVEESGTTGCKSA